MSGSIDIYGSEVAPVKNMKELPQDLAQRLELPEEALLGALKLTVTGGRQALVENHRGLLDYSEERILISAIKGKLAISGTGLSLAAMNKSELLVKGRIQSVEWE